MPRAGADLLAPPSRRRARASTFALAAAVVVLLATAASASAARRLALGVSVPSFTRADLNVPRNLLGTPPPLLMSYEDWSYDPFNPAILRRVAARDAIPVVSWEPWLAREGLDQSAFGLRVVAGGAYDAYLAAAARTAADYGNPILVRMASEMNGNWFPWGQRRYGNTPASSKRAWRHVVSIFRREGATNVRFVWTPNITKVRGIYRSLYPGDAWVDMVGLDGYNRGGDRGWNHIGQVFGFSYRQLAAVTKRPMLIAETASGEVGGSKAQWVRRGLLTTVPRRFPRVRAVMWFNRDKEVDWRINSSPTALSAFRTVARSSRYGVARRGHPPTLESLGLQPLSARHADARATSGTAPDLLPSPLPVDRRPLSTTRAQLAAAPRRDHGSVVVPLRCEGGDNCAGVVAVYAVRDAAARRARPGVVGQVAFSLSSGARASIAVPLEGMAAPGGAVTAVAFSTAAAVPPSWARLTARTAAHVAPPAAPL